MNQQYFVGGAGLVNEPVKVNDGILVVANKSGVKLCLGLGECFFIGCHMVCKSLEVDSMV